MKILGIDPGLANTGWGLVDFNGQHFRPISYGVITTDTEQRAELRISFIAQKISEIATENLAEHTSIEDIYFAKNEKSAMSVAKVIGAITFAMYLKKIPVTLFTPLQIKMAITGNGRAEKKQIQEMVRLLLCLGKIPRPDHAADALASAVCYGNMSSTFNKLGIKK